MGAVNSRHLHAAMALSVSRRASLCIFLPAGSLLNHILPCDSTTSRHGFLAIDGILFKVAFSYSSDMLSNQSASASTRKVGISSWNDARRDVSEFSTAVWNRERQREV